MANVSKKQNFKKIASIKDTEGSGFGQYSEANGGGSPKGGVFGGQSGRVGWDERVQRGEVKDSEHRSDQPRTDDGKFTYNSVNGKETKYDGRGKTVNPLLTGGENGIKIEDVKQQFSAKSGNLYDRYKDKWYQKGSLKVVSRDGKIKVAISAEDIWEIAKYSFNVEKGGFFGGQKGQTVAEEDVFARTKGAGRPEKQERVFRQQALQDLAEKYILGVMGDILKEGEEKAQREAAKGGAGQKPGANPNPNLKHSPAQIKEVRDALKAAGYDETRFTDEQIDQIYDKFVAKK